MAVAFVLFPALFPTIYIRKAVFLWSIGVWSLVIGHWSLVIIRS